MTNVSNIFLIVIDEWTLVAWWLRADEEIGEEETGF